MVFENNSFSGDVGIILFQVHRCEGNGKVTAVIENLTACSQT